jgi:hypothetical protein
MLKRNCFSPALTSSIAVLIILTFAGLAGCDRGASDEVGAARRFADAVANNDAMRRDTMIATAKLKEFFTNDFVARDMISWFRSFYDVKNKKFIAAGTADVDRNLQPELEGALLDTNRIEETGMVKVKSPTAGDDAIFFWMVRQQGKPWRVAMVTKGESEVNFQ